MINKDHLVLKTITNGYAFSKVDSSLLADIDDLKNSTWENTAESTDVTGNFGVLIGSFDKSKGASFSGTSATIVDGLLALQTGSQIEIGEQLIPNHMDYIEVSGEGTVTTAYKAEGTVGAEIKYLYKYESSSFNSVKYTQAAQADATHFAYDPATKVITLPTDVFKAGDIVVAQYDFKCEAKRLTNVANKFPGVVRLELNAIFTDICTGLDYLGKIIFPNAKADGNFSFETGDEPAVHNFSFKAMQDKCSGINGIIWDYFVYDASDIK